MEAGLGGGRSLLQYRGGYRERERQREKQQRRMKQKAEVYPPVEFKVAEKSQSWSSSDSLQNGKGCVCVGLSSERTWMGLCR